METLIKYFTSSGLVPREQAEEMAAQFNALAIQKNKYFLSEREVSDRYLFLETGFMRSFAHNLEGAEITTNFHKPGQVVFEVSSFFNRTPSKENIQALSDCHGWYITYHQLNTLFHAAPAFREFGRSVLVKGYSALKSRMLAMITETAEERYLSLLTASPEIFQAASLKYIASYLGITDTSLSRIRKEFTER